MPKSRSAKIITFTLLIAVVCVGGYVMRQSWLRFIADSLVCRASEAPSDAVLVDVLERNYLLFARARELQDRKRAPIVLVPLLSSPHDQAARAVELGIVEVMCRVARVADCTTFQASLVEPFSLNVARRTAEELHARGARSVLLVTSGFRSRRAATVYWEILAPLGIAVHCQPVFASRTPDNWFRTHHGIQEVVLQSAKLLYYRLGVMQGLQ